MLEVFSKEKIRWGEVGNFLGKGGGSLESLKYQVFPYQILSHNTFTNLSLTNLLRAQSKMKITFYAKNMQSNKNTIKTC